MVYTRYADDLHFSTSEDYTRHRAATLARAAADLLRDHGFQANSAKTRVSPPGSRRIVLGLLVDGEAPRLTKRFRRDMERHVHFLRKNGASSHARAVGARSVSALRAHLLGRANWAAYVELNYGVALVSQLQSIAWPI